MVNTHETEDRLKQDFEAVKTGQRVKARELLIDIVEQDEENEKAWLWFSGAVDTDADKQRKWLTIYSLN